MKTKLHNLLSLFLIGSGIALFMACDESLTIDEATQGNPEIISFEPASGKAGTEITITGEYLRDVEKATVGQVDARIRYIISQKSVVIVVPAGAKSGVITLSTKEVSAQSEQTFTMVYPVPTYTNVPASGKVDEEIEIQGTNLDVVSKVLFNDVEGIISFQNEKELVVKVPFVIEDNVDVKLFYSDDIGEHSIGTTGQAFEIIKPRPAIDGTFPVNVNEGQSITLTGENLNLIEKILFGDVEAQISRKEATTLILRVPTLPATATVAVTAAYYEGTATLNLSDACEVFIPKVFFYPNLMMGVHRHPDFGNLFNASTGNVLAACALKEAATQPTIDFATNINSTYDINFHSPSNTVNSIRNYWCDGKTFIKGKTLAELEAEGYGEFMSTKTQFLVLLTSKNADQAEIINKVTSGQIDDISPEATPTLFNGNIVASKNSVRSRRTAEAVGTETDAIYKEGSVIVFRNARKEKVGIIYIKQVNVAYDQNSTYVNSNSTVVFDLYYQR